MAVVLGIDLAYRTTGWALVDDGGRLIEFGHFTTIGESPLGVIYSSIVGLIETYCPDVVWKEAPLAQSNCGMSPDTAIKLGMAHGVCDLAVMHSMSDGSPPMGVSPQSVKVFATKITSASKTLMKQAAYRRWRIELTDDEADAAFVASYGARRL